jgi:hypothetical protein
MVYIFSEFNFVTLALAVIAGGGLFLLMTCIYGFRVGSRKESHPEDYEDFANKLDARMNKQCAFINALFGLIAVGLMVSNIPHRTEELLREGHW